MVPRNDRRLPRGVMSTPSRFLDEARCSSCSPKMRERSRLSSNARMRLRCLADSDRQHWPMGSSAGVDSNRASLPSWCPSFYRITLATIWAERSLRQPSRPQPARDLHENILWLQGTRPEDRGTPDQLAGIPPGFLKKHIEMPPDTGNVECQTLFRKQRLKPQKSGIFLGWRNLARQFRSGRPGPWRIGE